MSTPEIVFACINSAILLATAIFIFLTIKSPINAVEVGRTLNDEQENDRRQRNLFLTLFAYRGTPVHYRFVEALNQIEIIFHEHPQILTAWYNLYDAMQLGGAKETEHHRKKWDDLRVVLLDEMAHVLNYASLQQLRIQKAYYPEGHLNHQNLDFDIKRFGLIYLQRAAKHFDYMEDFLENSKTQQQGLQEKETKAS